MKSTISGIGFVKWLILLNPFIDVVNGLLSLAHISISFGQLIRPLLLVVLLLVLAKNSKNKFTLVLILSCFLIIKDLVAHAVTLTSFFSSISYDLRYIYVFVLALLMDEYCKRGWTKNLTKWAKDAIVIIAIIVVASQVFQIGKVYVESYKGFFIEVNALTALLVWGSSMWLYDAFVESRDKKAILFALIVCCATFTQATKTGIIGTIICCLYLLFFIGPVSNKWGKFMLVGIVVLLACAYFYYYFQYGHGSVNIRRWAYFMERQDTTSFLLSTRNQTALTMVGIWFSNLAYILFGTGFSLGSDLIYAIQPNAPFGGAEMDFIDLFYYYGAIISILICIPLFKMVGKSVKYLSKKEERKSIFAFSYLLIFLISFLGGHVLSSPLAGVFFIIAFLNIKYS